VKKAFVIAGVVVALTVTGCTWLSGMRGDSGEKTEQEWMGMFGPTSIQISFFTQSRDFDDNKGDDGLEICAQPFDKFGDPTKAVGNWRFEVFEYKERSLNRRGRRLCHWFVPVLTPEDNARYYDSIDRSYRFPLLWDVAIPAGSRVIVQATFYPPGGFERKLIAERVIRIEK
jgi:hypothetical protein